MNFIHLKSSSITWKVHLDPTHWPAPSWLVSLVGRVLHRYRKGHGFKSRTGLNVFQVLFSTTRFSSVLSWEDLLISFLHRSAIYEFHIFKIIIRYVRVSHENSKWRWTEGLTIDCAFWESYVRPLIAAIKRYDGGVFITMVTEMNFFNTVGEKIVTSESASTATDR